MDIQKAVQLVKKLRIGCLYATGSCPFNRGKNEIIAQLAPTSNGWDIIVWNIEAQSKIFMGGAHLNELKDTTSEELLRLLDGYEVGFILYY